MMLQTEMHGIAQIVVALDVGGTTVKSGVVERGGRLRGAPIVTPIDSNAPADNVLDALAAVIRARLADDTDAPLAGVALGFPAPFDYAQGICYIKAQPKFLKLYGVNLKQGLAARLQLDPTVILFRNDAAAAVVGEARHGAGRPYHRLIGITLGTGCGSAFVEGGAPLTEGAGVPPGGEVYALPFRGQRADDWFSIRGLLARAHAAGGDYTDPRALADAARDGKAGMAEVFTAFGADLALFLSPLVREFGAQAVLILGGLAGAFDLFGAALAAGLPVPVRRGELGSGAGLVGAADLFFGSAPHARS